MRVKYILLGFAFLLMQSTWLHQWPSMKISFQPLLLFIVWLGFRLRPSEDLPIVLLFGLFTDLFSIAPLGLSLSSYTALFLTQVVFLRRLLSPGHFRPVWTIVFSLLGSIFSIVAGWLFDFPIEATLKTIPFWILQPLFNGICAWPLFPFLDRLLKEEGADVIQGGLRDGTRPRIR